MPPKKKAWGTFLTHSWGHATADDSSETTRRQRQLDDNDSRRQLDANADTGGNDNSKTTTADDSSMPTPTQAATTPTPIASTGGIRSRCRDPDARTGPPSPMTRERAEREFQEVLDHRRRTNWTPPGGPPDRRRSRSVRNRSAWGTRSLDGPPGETGPPCETTRVDSSDSTTPWWRRRSCRSTPYAGVAWQHCGPYTADNDDDKARVCVCVCGVGVRLAGFR